MNHIAELVEQTVKLLVNEPDAVQVEHSADRSATIYMVTVAPNDVGRVIGKDGRVISSVRQVISGVGAKNRIKTVVKVQTND
ncbi:MAG: KH domain-containing protein [Armatimonadetes bacterium]|nr:KH domain-containing protein [Armatimonadota bacterium]